MSVGNYFFKNIQALKQNKKVVTSTYTVRTGRTADGHIVDNPVDVADAAASFTLTVPDGEVMGQLLLIVMSSNASTIDCTVNVLHHLTSDPEDRILDAADETLLMLWSGTEWVPVYDTGSDS